MSLLNLFARYFVLFHLALFSASFVVAADPVLELPADTPGQADLDKAVQRQLNASTVADFSGVIELCESAEKKGLDDASKKMAHSLLASALQERGDRYADLAIARMVQGARASAAKEPAKDDKNTSHNTTKGDKTKSDDASAVTAAWQSDRKAALADLERSVKLNPKQPKALFFIARLNFLAEGDTSRGREALDKAIECADDEARFKAEALLLRANTTKDRLQRSLDLDEAVKLTPGESGALKARAAALADQGKLSAAFNDVDKALEIDPKDITCYQLKALILVNQKKLDEAMDNLEKAHAIAPTNPDLLVTMARVAIIKGNSTAAIEDLDKALVLVPNSIELRAIRVDFFRALGDRKKVLAEIDKMLELRPGVASLMRDRAVLLVDLDRKDEAIAEFEKLHKKDPNDALTQMQLGLLYTSAKEYHKGIELLSAVLATHPNEWLAYRTRADAYLNMGQRDKAVEDYDRAFKLRPSEMGILNNLAWVLSTAPEKKLRDGKRAVTLATDACKLSEYKTDYILSTLAAAYAEQGNFEDATKWAKKAVEVSSKEHQDELKKELESYTAKKPWREALSDDKQPKDKASTSKPAADAKKQAAAEAKE